MTQNAVDLTTTAEHASPPSEEHDKSPKYWTGTRTEKNLKKMQRQLPHNLHFRVCVHLANFRETALSYKHSGSKLDECSWLVLSEPNTLSERVPSASQRWGIRLPQPAVTLDTHVMPSPPWANKTGPLAVRLAAVFRTWGPAIFHFSPPTITHPLVQQQHNCQEIT